MKRQTRGWTKAASVSGTPPPVSQTDLTLLVRNDGYFPQTLRASANKDLTLNLTTNATYSCARDFFSASYHKQQMIVEFDEARVSEEQIIAAAKMKGYTAVLGG